MSGLYTPLNTKCRLLIVICFSLLSQVDLFVMTCQVFFDSTFEVALIASKRFYLGMDAFVSSQLTLMSASKVTQVASKLLSLLMTALMSRPLTLLSTFIVALIASK
jgi:hypothetical protein